MSARFCLRAMAPQSTIKANSLISSYLVLDLSLL
jgi:hypothetical protein